MPTKFQGSILCVYADKKNLQVEACPEKFRGEWKSNNKHFPPKSEFAAPFKRSLHKLENNFIIRDVGNYADESRKLMTKKIMFWIKYFMYFLSFLFVLFRDFFFFLYESPRFLSGSIIYTRKTATYTMVLISDSNSQHVAHVWRKLNSVWKWISELTLLLI